MGCMTRPAPGVGAAGLGVSAGNSSGNRVSPIRPKIAVKPAPPSVDAGDGGVADGAGRGAALCASMINVGESTSSRFGALGVGSARDAGAGLGSPESTFPKILVKSPAGFAASGGGGGGGGAAGACRCGVCSSTLDAITGGAAGVSILLNARVNSPGACGAILTGGGVCGAATGTLTWSSQVVKSTNELMKSVTATGEPSTSTISRSFSRAGGFKASRRARVADRCSGVSESR